MFISECYNRLILLTGKNLDIQSFFGCDVYVCVCVCVCVLWLGEIFMLYVVVCCYKTEWSEDPLHIVAWSSWDWWDDVPFGSVLLLLCYFGVSRLERKWAWISAPTSMGISDNKSFKLCT
jgi:hypothetical protein